MTNMIVDGNGSRDRGPRRERRPWQRLRIAPSSTRAMQSASSRGALLLARLRRPHRLPSTFVVDRLVKLAKGVALDIPAGRAPNANEILVTGAITV
jgi:hypothetical protein